MKEYYAIIGLEAFVTGLGSCVIREFRQKFSEDEIRSSAEVDSDQPINLPVLKRFAKNTLEKFIANHITKMSNIPGYDLSRMADDSSHDTLYTIYVYNSDDVNDAERTYKRYDDPPATIAKWSIWETDVVKEMLGKEENKIKKEEE